MPATQILAWKSQAETEKLANCVYIFLLCFWASVNFRRCSPNSGLLRLIYTFYCADFLRPKVFTFLSISGCRAPGWLMCRVGALPPRPSVDLRSPSPPFPRTSTSRWSPAKTLPVSASWISSERQLDFWLDFIWDFQQGLHPREGATVISRARHWEPRWLIMHNHY